MGAALPKVLIAANADVREKYLDAAQMERLERLVDVELFACEIGGIYNVQQDPEVSRQLQERLGEVAGLIISSGAPTIDAATMDNAPNLRIIGELEGDRFAGRIDVEAAWERGIRTVDTTNGSSYPVAEWALALIIISLRNAGQHFRRLISGSMESYGVRTDIGYLNGQLTGKRVGLIGCGHIGRRLIKMLRPFETEIWVHDPYLSADMADAVGFLKTSLDNVLTRCDVIVALVPQTPATDRMLGRREFDLIPDGRVFVNVSRGSVVDSDALVARLKRGGLVAGIDVFDPEPVGDHEITQLENVFISPHIAGVLASSYTEMFRLMIDELERFFNGHETLFDLTPRTLDNRRGNQP
jgi:phosphoglycerate dehydrogenase-like enzyme